MLRNKKEVFDDLASRFIVNVPEEELTSTDRVFFHIELASWFYEDFYLPRYPYLKPMKLLDFSRELIKYVNHDEEESVKELLSNYYQYKSSIPVCGAVLLNAMKDKAVFVKGKTSKLWGFPKGKINRGESQAECAAREVFEEIGYDISQLINKEKGFVCTCGKKKLTMFLIPNISEKSIFKTMTRKEITGIHWVNLENINLINRTEGRKTFTYASTVVISKVKRLIEKGEDVKYFKPKSAKESPKAVQIIQGIQHVQVAKSVTDLGDSEAKKNSNPKNTVIGERKPEFPFKFDVMRIMKQFKI